jgi:hypothetical protein
VDHEHRNGEQEAEEEVDAEPGEGVRLISRMFTHGITIFSGDIKHKIILFLRFLKRLN